MKRQKVLTSLSSRSLQRNSLTEQKFKPLQTFNNSTNRNGFNELQCKYDVFNNGSPNQFQSNLTRIKMSNLKSDLNILDLPQIESFLNEMKLTDQTSNINKRDFNLHPQKVTQSKFKELMSEKQEIKDFMKWFQAREKEIENQKTSNARKFHDKQHLILSGFNQMVNQVGKMSKNRAQIIKMLWNKENFQVGKVIKDITSSSLKKQRNLLQNSKDLHRGYQGQIAKLRSQNIELFRKLNEQSTINKAIVNTLRCSKRRLKRYELLIKKLRDFNVSIKQENLILIQQNTRMIINNKQISPDQAKILTYRILQIEKQRQNMRENPLKMKKVFSQIKRNVKRAVDQQPILDLHQKKTNLYNYLIDRMNKYPQQKQYVGQNYFSDEDDGLSSIEHLLKQLINTKEIQAELSCERHRSFNYQDTGINTDYTQEDEQFPRQEMRLCFDIGIQVNTLDKLEQWSDSRKKERQKLIQLLQKDKLILAGSQDLSLAKDSIKQLREREGKVRNSLIILQMQKREQFHRINQQKDRKSGLVQSANQNQRSQRQRNSANSLKSRESVKKQISIAYNGDYQRTSRLSKFYLNCTKLGPSNENISISSYMRKKSSGRKSKSFQEFLKDLKKFQEQQQTQKLNTIQSEGNRQNPLNQILMQAKSSQEKVLKVKSLYFSYLQKNGNAKAPHNIQKYMNKIVMSIFKNLYISLGKPYSFILQFVDVTNTTYGKVKGSLNKFLNYVAIINKTQTANHLIKILSLLLGVNKNHRQYEVVNGIDVSQLYFKLFFALSIKSPSETSFNPWRSKTSISKITNFLEIKRQQKELQAKIDPPALEIVLKEFMSQNKRQYLSSRMNQFICSSNLIDSTCFEENKSFDSKNLLVDLNQVLLYVLEVYLIEKKNYYDSYHNFIDFLVQPGTDEISLETLVFLLDIMGYSQQEQTQMLLQIFNFKNQAKLNKKYSQRNQSKIPGIKNKPIEVQSSSIQQSRLKADRFYMICVKFDFPLFQQLNIAVHQQFVKEMTQQSRQKYYKRLTFQDWNRIHKDLQRKLNRVELDKAYLRTLDKLDSYLASKKQDRNDIFSILYKIILLQAVQCNDQGPIQVEEIEQSSRKPFKVKNSVQQYNIYQGRTSNQHSIQLSLKCNELSSIIETQYRSVNQMHINIMKPRELVKPVEEAKKSIDQKQNIDI